VAAVGVAAVGVLTAWWVYLSGRVEWLALRTRFASVWRLLAHRLYIDEIYEFFTVTLGGAVAAFLAVNVERRVIDGAVNGAAGVVGATASRARRLQTGLVRTYAVGVLGGAVLIVAFLVFRTT
jgi:NADH-quinone oxidoreductase subunit L